VITEKRFKHTKLKAVVDLTGWLDGDLICMGHLHSIAAEAVLKQSVVNGRVVERKCYTVLTEPTGEELVVSSPVGVRGWPMKIEQLIKLVRTLNLMIESLEGLNKWLDAQVPPFFGKCPELETVVNQLWVAVAAIPLLTKARDNLLAEYNQQRLGG